MKQYNVIGDIHGRESWKYLVNPESVNIFLGDYFDPYDDFSSEQLLDNFYSIIEFKKLHPETVLLYGNHDFHYLFPKYAGTTSRYSHWSAKKYLEAFEDTKSLFHGVTYCPVSEDGLTKYLISHAGVTRDWFFNYCQSDDFPSLSLTDDSRKVPRPEFTEKFINNLWLETEDGREFSFEDNCDPMDTYGTSPQQSPIWVRPESLIGHNLYKGTDVIQVVGHTQMYHVQDLSDNYGCVFTDCLGQTVESYKFKF